MRNSLRFKTLLQFSIVAIGISIASTSSASATQTLTLIAEDSFDYTGNIVGKSGGSGFINNWSDAYSGSNYSTQTPGLTYPGLTTSGGYMYSCSASPNQVCGVSRQIPTQSTRITYIQFLVHFGSQYGGGTPNLRFNNAVGARSGGIGYGDGGVSPAISILNAELNPLRDGTSSSGTLNAQNLVILRIDYTSNRSTLFINPDLATFSYFNPPVANATYANFAPEIRTIEFFARNYVKYDELKIYNLTGTTLAQDEASAKAVAEEEREKREAERRAEIKATRELINLALVTKTPVTPEDLVKADLPITTVESLNLAYQELISIKYALTAPLSPEALAEIKFNKFMKYAMYERMTGVNSGEVIGRDLVKFGVISEETLMKQLTTYQLMKHPLAERDSINKVNQFFSEANERFVARKARLVAVIAKNQSR